MTESRAYALSGGMFGLIAISAIVRHDVGLGILILVGALGCALRARVEAQRG